MKINIARFLVLAMGVVFIGCSNPSNLSNPSNSLSTWASELKVGTAISATIESYDEHLFFVYLSKGHYTVSLTNQASDCGVIVSECDSEYAFPEADLIEINSHPDATDEIGVIPISKNDYYIIRVDEWDDLGASSYTLLIENL